MAIISDITNELSKMDAALFQQLGEELLRKIYKPKDVIPVGLGIEKNTTIKGSPDSVFIMPEGKILIEYTTHNNRPKNSFFKKLKNDLIACLTEDKTHIPITEVNTIVLFSNQRIDVEIRTKLDQQIIDYPHINIEIYSVDRIASALTEYPYLLKVYLGILSFPGLTEIESFIKRYNEPKFAYPIPLDNDYFEFKDNSIAKGIESLYSNNILIISGNAGMGKTRYALEIAQRYGLSTNSKVFVLEENARNISDSLYYLDSRQQYVFIIDDANRTAIWTEVIKYFLNENYKNIKLIGTVRTYALNSVTNICHSVAGVKIIEMNESPEDLAAKILNSFGISNKLWHKRINAITNRNIRLSVMCAQIAKTKNDYQELYNVEGIYTEYYNPIFSQIRNSDNDYISIKVIAIIHFYKILDLEQDFLFDQIKDVFGISKDDFLKTCDHLFKKECIDKTEYNIVKVPDQNFGNFVFYKCFFELKCLKLSTLMEKLYRMNHRLSDCVYSVLICFNKDTVIKYVKTSFNEAWERVSKIIDDLYNVEHFLECFCNLVPETTFLYIHNKIERLKKGEGKSLLDIDNSIISMLSRFSHSEKSDMCIAISLMIEYVHTFPSEINNMVHSVQEDWIYEEDDYANGYQRNADVLECLINATQRSTDTLQFIGKIVPFFLKFTYNFCSVKGREFTSGSHVVCITDEIKAIRIKAWNWIVSNLNCIDQVDFIKDLYNDYHDLPEIKRELVNNEFNLIQKCVNRLEINNNYQLCEELFRFSKRVERILGKNTINIDWSKSHPIYILESQINKGCDRHNCDRHAEIKQHNIYSISESQSLSETRILLDNLAKLASYKSHNIILLNYALESVLRKNAKDTFNLWQYGIDKGYEIMPSRIISIYVTLGYKVEDLVEFIKLQQREIRSNIILDFVMIVDNPSLYFTIQEISEAIRYQHPITYKTNGIINKFFPNGPTVNGQRSVLAAILNRLRNGQATYGSEDFLRHFIKQHPSKSYLIKFTYIQNIKLKNNISRFDCKNTLLKDILSIYPDFWIDCCEAIPYFASDYHINIYDFIWKLNNHDAIIESTLLYYANRDKRGIRGMMRDKEKDNLYVFFYNLKDDKPVKFIDNMIVKYCHDSILSGIIFNIIIRCMGDSRIQHFITFITHNEDIEAFKALNLFPNEMSGGNSFKSAINHRINFVSTLKNKIKSLTDCKYLKHVIYLDKELESLEHQLNYELKTEHKNLLYDA